MAYKVEKMFTAINCMSVERPKDFFHIRRDQHYFKSFRIWIDTSLKNPSNRSLANAKYLINKFDCANS